MPKKTTSQEQVAPARPLFPEEERLFAGKHFSEEEKIQKCIDVLNEMTLKYQSAISTEERQPYIDQFNDAMMWLYTNRHNYRYDEHNHTRPYSAVL